MGKTVFKIEKIKSMNSLKGRAGHNFRLAENIPNVDVSRSYLNKTLVNEGCIDYVDLWKCREYNLNATTGSIKKRKNSVYAYEVYLSFSHGSELNVDEWANENIAWLKEQFGEDNLLSASLHMDESTPHIHAIIMPIDEKGHLNAKNFTGGAKKMHLMRNSYDKAMKKFGLEAGQLYTKATYSETSEFYARVQKASRITAPRRKKDEPEEEYLNRLDEWIKDNSMNIIKNDLESRGKVRNAYGKYRETYSEYKDAMEFYDILYDKFYGDKDMIRKELAFLAGLEMNVKRTSWESLKNKILEKCKDTHKNLEAGSLSDNDLKDI